MVGRLFGIGQRAAVTVAQGARLGGDFIVVYHAYGCPHLRVIEVAAIAVICGGGKVARALMAD